VIYLASTSPRRKALLKKAGIVFRVLRPAYEEDDFKGPPSKIVQRHALKKAQSSIPQIQNGVVLAADTIVYLDGDIVGKPKNRNEAIVTLKKLQGRWHSVYTGVAILKIITGRVIRQIVFYEKTGVRLKSLTARGIKNYFKKVNPLDKAGAYAIQSRHGGIIEDVRGLFSNAVGLPVEAVLKKMKKKSRILTQGDPAPG